MLLGTKMYYSGSTTESVFERALEWAKAFFATACSPNLVPVIIIAIYV
jgi:hypothetical protein